MSNELSTNIVPELIESISHIILNARRRVAAAINNDLIVTYWTIGKEIVDKEHNNNIDNQTSRQIILQLSRQLTQTLGIGFSRYNLFNMRKLYLEFPDVQTLSGHISWSHVCELLLIDNHNKRNFYLSQIQHENLSVRDLRRKMARMEYERALPNTVSIELPVTVNNYFGRRS